MKRFKTYLVNAVARETGQSRIVVKLIVDALGETVAQELAHGNSVVWTGLGTWEVKERQSFLPGSKPFRGERSTWGRLRWVVFRASQPLRKLLRSQDVQEDTR